MEQSGDAHDAAAIWSNDPSARRPTRPPKDPLLEVTKITVHSLDGFENALKDYLERTPGNPEHAQCEIEVWGGVQLLVSYTENGHLAANEKKPLSIAEALVPHNDPKIAMKRQRAIAKCFIDSIQRVDGFRYAFHNNWKSGDDYRFSYYCNDSLLNKDRVANGKTGSAGKRAYKPVYDCKGVMAVKFSSQRHCVDIVYKHVPVHETYEARAPPPRKDAKRRRDWEISHPNRVRAPQYLDAAVAVAKPALEDQEQTPKAAKPKRKKAKTPPNTAEADLRQESLRSLLELIRTGEGDASDPALTQTEQPRQQQEQQQQQQQQQQPPPPQRVQPPNRQSQPSSRPATAQPQVQPPQLQQQQSQQNRVRHNCEICRSRRSKCDGARPICQPCRQRNWPCFYTESSSGLKDKDLQAGDGESSRSIDSSHPIPMDLSTNSQVGNGSLTNADLTTQLIETRTELALVREQLKESQERLKQLEAEKTRPTPTPAPRRTPQVSGIRAQQNRDERAAHNNSYGAMAYQMTQTPNQSYAPNPQAQTQQQPAYGNPQPQRQPSFAPATQPNFVPPQPPTANQHAATNMYNQQMRWPPYPYANMQQPQQYQNMSTRMR